MRKSFPCPTVYGYTEFDRVFRGYVIKSDTEYPSFCSEIIGVIEKTDYAEPSFEAVLTPEE